MKKSICIISLILVIFSFLTCDMIDPSAVNTIMTEIQRDNPLDSGFWDRRSDFPGVRRGHPVTFSIDGKGYVGLGIDWAGTATDEDMLTDLWMYDPALDSWVQKKSFPGTGVLSASSFVINDEAYVIGGRVYDKTTANYSGSYFCWKYTPVTDVWTQIASLPAPLGEIGYWGNRSSTTTAAGKGWVLINGYGILVYDPILDNWTQDASAWSENSSFIPQQTGGTVYTLNGPELHSYDVVSKTDTTLTAIDSNLLNLDNQLTTFVISDVVYIYTGKNAYGEESLLSYEDSVITPQGSPATTIFSSWAADVEGYINTLLFSDNVYMFNVSGEFYLYKP